MLTSIKVWLRKHDSFSHIVAASAVFFPVWFALAFFGVPMAHWIVAGTIIGAYYGRERRDYEIYLNQPLYQSSFNLKTYIPWTWDGDGKRDFFYPFFALMAYGTIIEVLPKVHLIVPTLEPFFTKLFS